VLLTTLLAGLAFAGIVEDVEFAADADKPLELRQAAFARLHEESAVDPVVALARNKETTPARRWVAIRSLGLNTAPSALAALLEFLESENAPTRIAALSALGERKDRSVSGRVAARLTDKALLVRHAAADALGLLGDPATLPDLGRALGDSSNNYLGTSLWLRRHFVEAMGRIGTTEAIRYLAPALDDADPAVVTAAVLALETVAGFSYREGRTDEQQTEAWRRWSKGR
jgi:HEAT repeat protein